MIDQALEVSRPSGFGTVLFIAPFRNRSGYGVAARAVAMALHAAGVPLKCVTVDSTEPGLDDCDLGLLDRLEKSPLRMPVTALFFHVPSDHWVKLPLPPGSKRIIFTTFDSSAQNNAPPEAWIRVCNAMDHVWMTTQAEADVFVRSGLDAFRVRVLQFPHPWIANPLLPPVQPVPDMEKTGARFRFLSIAMFQPRRRWDTLIEAFLLEFAGGEPVELRLRVNYPSWHPVAGQPQRDLRSLVERLQRSTGSKATVVLDEELGTRMDICRLIDSCHVYVSTDTCGTAPISEAMLRRRPVILPEGLGLSIPLDPALTIPTDPGRQRPLSAEELLYQPHHRGRKMPLLAVEDVRGVLRRAWQLPIEKLRGIADVGAQAMDDNFAPAQVIPPMIEALRESASSPTAVRPSASGVAQSPSSPTVSVAWMGSFLDYGSLSFVNRELTSQLARQRGLELKLGPKVPISDQLRKVPELEDLWRHLQPDAERHAAITVRHSWPPNWRLPESGRLVVMQPWEFGSLPEEWVRNSSKVAEFWAYSEYVRNVYVSSGVPAEKVKVVPLGIDPERFHPEVPPLELATKKRFKFLFVGGTIHRKGPDVMLNAYLRRFTAQDDVCLVIKDFGGKSVYAGQTLESQIRAAQAKPGAPELLYLNEELPPDALPRLYAACDCLVHPYRGEGFGLPILEAMACGLPVIVTAGGSADDFATKDFAWQIPSVRKPFGDFVSGLKLVGTGWFLEPDGGELETRMRWAFEHPVAARALGRRASEHVRQNWTWERAAQIAANRLRELASPADLTAQTVGRGLLDKHAVVSPARSTPLVGLLGGLAKARELLASRKMPEAWCAASEAIQARPHHPEAWLLLAEIALALGDSAAARRCADRARHMAPGWKPARQFLTRRLGTKSKSCGLPLPPPLVEGGLVEPRLSVCIITRNEEKFIHQCLASVKDVAAEIIVVDTGSTDQTIDIAKSFGAQVHHFDWCDDFSAARNAALERARGDWILILDADEELPPAEHARLRKDMAQEKVLAFRLPMVNAESPAGGRIFVPRLFRNAPGAFFIGRIHEQVFPSLNIMVKSWGLEGRLGTAQLVHHGYTAEVVRERNKIERNLALLRREIVERPEDPNITMNLGLELVRSGEFSQGLDYYREAFRLMSAQPATDVAPELREVLLTQFSAYLRQARALDEVISVLTSPLANNGGLTASLHFALGLAYYDLERFADAVAQMRRCLATLDAQVFSPINQDIRSALPHHCLAVSLARQGDRAGAEKAFQAGLSTSSRVEELKVDFARMLHDQGRSLEAIHQLHEVIIAQPQHVVAWRFGGQVSLSQPEFLEFARDWTAEAINHLPEDNELLAQRAEALLLSQDVVASRPLWLRLQEREPQLRTAAALVLCELAGNLPISTPVKPEDSVPASRAFIGWYRKCLRFGAKELVLAVNSRVEDLRRVLPEAAQVFEAALKEAGLPAAPELCTA
jgi:glycosyltransferase involved in cell wall biosynthesis/tetratricopeptide (TPR) repeat protein